MLLSQKGNFLATILQCIYFIVLEYLLKSRVDYMIFHPEVCGLVSRIVTHTA
nr:MAG TPA: hypothetical protein [Bacteriophage sp.]